MQYSSTHTDITFGSFMFVCFDFLAYVLVPYKNFGKERPLTMQPEFEFSK